MSVGKFDAAILPLIIAEAALNTAGGNTDSALSILSSLIFMTYFSTDEDKKLAQVAVSKLSLGRSL